MMKRSILYVILFIDLNLIDEVVMFEYSFSDTGSVVQALLDENKVMKIRMAELEHKDAETNLQVGNLKSRSVALEEKCSKISDENLESVGVANENGSFNSNYTSTEGNEETQAGNSETNFAPGFDKNIDQKQNGISSSELLLRRRQSPKRLYNHFYFFFNAIGYFFQ